MSDIIPTGYFVLIEMDEIEREKKTEGGIIIPEKDVGRVQEACDSGIVVDIGPQAFTGIRGIPDELPALERASRWGLKIGDRVVYESYQGKSMAGLRSSGEADKERYKRLRVIPDNQIMAVKQ